MLNIFMYLVNLMHILTILVTLGSTVMNLIGLRGARSQNK